MVSFLTHAAPHVSQPCSAFPREEPGCGAKTLRSEEAMNTLTSEGGPALCNNVLSICLLQALYYIMVNKLYPNFNLVLGI